MTPRIVPTPYSYTAVTLGDLQIPLLRLFTLGIATAAFLALYVLLSHTLIGKAMRGLSQSRDAAAMVGIDHRRVARLAVLIGIGLSGLAGATLAPVYSVQPTMGSAFVFKAFAIVIIGGLGNIAGAAIAAIMLGILESLIGGFFPLTLADLGRLHRDDPGAAVQAGGPVRPRCPGLTQIRSMRFARGGLLDRC